MMFDKQSSTKSQPLRLNKIAVHFAKDRLPPVRQTYESELGCQFSKADHRGEVSGPCCFHESKSRRSFKVNLESGLWYCHGCQTGGDMVSFVQRRHNFSFIEAAGYLGALEETGQPAPPSPVVEVRFLVLDFDIDGVHHSVSVPDKPKNYASVIRNFYREAGTGLTALGLDKSESDEGEVNWSRLVLGHAELRELGVGL